MKETNETKVNENETTATAEPKEAETGNGKKEGGKKAPIALIAVLAAAVIVMACAFFFLREKPVKGSKNVVIEVTNKAQENTDYEVQTDAEFLRQAMEEAEGLTFSGTEGDYGMMVDTVNGERADYNEDGAYWSFYVNDEYCNYGIDSQPVEDGDTFRIVYTMAE